MRQSVGPGRSPDADRPDLSIDSLARLGMYLFMGDYDHKRFRQVMVDADTHRRLSAMKRPGDTFADVIRKLLPQGGSPGTKKGRSVKELLMLAEIADKKWRKRVETGEIRLSKVPRKSGPRRT